MITGSEVKYKKVLVWESIIVLGTFHVISTYALWLILSLQIGLKTLIFTWLMEILAILGSTAGSHRLWSHRSYKAKWQLKLFLAVAQTVAFQKTIFEWARDHRIHHKYTETDADPHNVKRGFFFAHMGWLFVRKHPDVIAKGKTIDLNDIYSDRIVMLQRKYYFPLVLVLCFAIPTYIPIYYWGETFSKSFSMNVLRHVIGINITGLVNSIAHTWGYRPYDKNIAPSESLLCSLFTCGEGWHNFHHAFPSDYKTGELGFGFINLTTGFIDLMAILGLAYDLKTASEELIRAKMANRGDGTRPYLH
ncbi:unnamed protein product [Phyllotreta striolata]|uniref:Fatty acid desaturase domain-containing protein n=1 Tax=Phyllotreta striolata TaxID=444603 RepID=A0A9N9TMG8_PHYSR|nr:unnamed protein product [Phyllotreta striolata]